MFLTKTMNYYETMPAFWGVCWTDFTWPDHVVIAPYPLCMLYRLWIWLLHKTKFWDWEKQMNKHQNELRQLARKEERDRIRIFIAGKYFFETKLDSERRAEFNGYLRELMADLEK